MKEINKELGMMRDRAAALSKGPEEGAMFDKVTVNARAFAEALQETTWSTTEQKMILDEYIALLTQLEVLELANADALNKRKDAITEAARAQEKMVNGVVGALSTIGELGQRLEELQKGPNALEYFEKVTAQVNKMSETLLKANVDLDVVNTMMEVYQRQ